MNYEKKKEMELKFIEDLLKNRNIYLEEFIDSEIVEKVSKMIIWFREGKRTLRNQ